jgi:hypothetical protein
MNNLKIKTIFIGINVFLLGLFSCNNPDKKYDTSDESNMFTTDSANEIIYHIVQHKEIDPESISIDSLYIQVSYQLKPDRLMIVAKSKAGYPDGLKLLLINPLDDNKLLYRSRGAWESWILHPVFFECKEPGNPTIILAAQGTSESWGQQVFAMENDQISEIGYLDVTRKEKADTAFYEDGYRLTDIGPFTEIKFQNGLLNFSFKTDSVFYYGALGDKVDVTLPGDQISYNFDGDSLRLMVDR